jgi:hypothetical protein
MRFQPCDHIKKFKRPLGERAYKKLYVIVTEGAKTEPQYFSIFNHDEMLFRIKCIDSKSASAPPKLLGIMKRFLMEILLDHHKNVQID